jgi:hypothetical protein
VTREDAETQVWEYWREASEHNTGCAMRVDSALTEEYEWGWVVVFSPVRPEERRQPYLHDRTAIDRAGRSYPLGTKGLAHALLRLGLVPDRKGRPAAEVEALWVRLTTPVSAAHIVDG